jgi:hypothetical protein
VFNPPPPPPAAPVTLLIAVSGVNSDYDMPMLVGIRDKVVIAAGVDKSAVSISASAGLGVESGRRLAEKFGALSSTAVVLTMTIQPTPVLTGTVIMENLARSKADGGLGKTVGDASKSFEDLKPVSTPGAGIVVLFISLAGEDDCMFKEDGVCDDGGPDPNTGAATSGLCPFGSDATDCGTRNAPSGAAFLKAQKDIEDEEAALNSDDPAPSTGQPYLPSYPGEPCFQQRSIHVSGRSPTTDLIAFSPKEWPVESHPVTKEARKTLQILQIGCELSQDDHASCYSDTNAFDATSAKSNTKRYELTRSSTGQYNQCARQIMKKNFWGMTAAFPSNKTAPSKCRWTASAKTKRYLKPITAAIDEQLIREVGKQMTNCENPDYMYDYAFEVCHTRGTCTANSFDCIPAYTVIAKGDPNKGDSRNLFKYDAIIEPATVTALGTPVPAVIEEVTVIPLQNPIEASGPLPSVYATPSEGPHFPCAVKGGSPPFNGEQLPCDDGASKSLGHTPSPSNLTVYVSNFNIEEVPLMTFDNFQVKFKYTATWSDRYAVHPCTINLYDTGKGVGANGKMIPSADWWVPSPTMLQKTDETVTHAKDLKVMHTATDAVVEPCDGKDGAMKCPWPKQLFLQEEVVLTATKSSSWNMNQHPFDTQILTGKVSLVSNIAYAVDLPKVSMNFTQGAMEAKQTTDSVKAIYGGTDWEVLSATVQHKKGDLEVSFRIEMRRASASVVFKVLIPVIAISLLSVLAGTLEANDRLLVVSVSVLAGSTMLDPDFLGLPAGTEGVPFLMALVIGHMAINAILLIYSLYIENGNFVQFWKLKEHESRTQGVVFEIYERSFARFRALASDTTIIGDCDNQIEESKEESKMDKLGKCSGIFKRQKTMVEDAPKDRPAPPANPDLDTSDAGQIKRLAELMWLMPMLIGNAVHGNTDNPPVPMGPTAAYDLDSADEQQDKDEAGQRVVAKAVGPAYLFVYFIIVLSFFAGGQQS